MVRNRKPSSPRPTDGTIVDFRIDFICDKVIMDDKTRTIWSRLIPDPRRFEWIKKNGTDYLYDKKDKVIIDRQTADEMMKQLSGIPIHYQPRRIDDMGKYLLSRKSSVEAGLMGVPETAPLSDPSAEFLNGIQADQHAFAVMCIDLAGSTKLSQSLEQIKYSRTISTLLSELSAIAYIYQGHVLKYTGDGLIAYYPEPCLTNMCDLALDCACVMKSFVAHIFNPVCAANELIPVQVRIGIDAGTAVITTLGNAATKRQKDLIGTTINIASKVQSLGSPGDVLVGEAANRILHTMWREGLTECHLPDNWQYRNESGQPYAVYRLKNEFSPILIPDSSARSQSA